jgi:transposase
VAPGTAEAASAHIRAVAERLKLVNRQIRDAHRRLDGLCAKLAGDGDNPPGQATEQRDVTILRSLPGVGRIVLATLLAEAAEPLRRRDYHALRTLCGVAPVTRRSGRRCIVIMRQACHIRLRTAVYHWARVAIQHDELSRRRYAALRQRGHSHGRALRSVADRLLAVACAMLTRRALFDPGYAGNRAAAA